MATGKQVAQVTTDGASWGPVWSPDGDKLVYMHLTGAIVDLNMVYISGSGANMTFKIETQPDGLLGPGWRVDAGLVHPRLWTTGPDSDPHGGTERLRRGAKSLRLRLARGSGGHGDFVAAA